MREWPAPNQPKHTTLPFAPIDPPGAKAAGKQSSTKSNMQPSGPGGPALSNALSTVVYLHTDQLGSVGAVTDAYGNVVSRTEYDPWGKVRAQSNNGGNAAQGTTRNYTGQKLDSTGLLYYNARYYDPALARFVSPDPMIAVMRSSVLTVAFQESALLAQVNAANSTNLQGGSWEHENSLGTSKPQVLNRYSYVLNNPLNWEDPTGHWHCKKAGCGGVVVNESNTTIWVFGVIYDPADANGNVKYPAGPKYRRQRMDGEGKTPGPPLTGGSEDAENIANHCGNARGQSPCDYVQGWFPLPGGQRSDTNLGMGDADAIMGDGSMLCDEEGYCYGGSGFGTAEVKFTSESEVHVKNGNGLVVSARNKPGVNPYIWLGGMLAGMTFGRMGFVTCTNNDCWDHPLEPTGPAPGGVPR